MSKEAMKLALRSLKELVPDDSDYAPALQGQRKRQEKAIAAIKQALEQPVQDAENKWRAIALQFDAHRMSALAHLQAMLKDPAKHADIAREFLSARPPAQPAPVALLCCGYTDTSAVKWNPFNGVVQCHNCGQPYTAPTTPPAPVQVPVAWIITFEKQNGDRETCAVMGRYKDVKASCDFGDPIPLYTTPPAQPAPVQQESVAWEELTNSQIMASVGRCSAGFSESRPLRQQWDQVCDLIRYVMRERGYTTPPAAQRPWVGLTKDEVLTIGKELGLKCKLGGNSNIDFDYAEAIEAKLKERNT